MKAVYTLKADNSSVLIGSDKWNSLKSNYFNI